MNKRIFYASRKQTKKSRKHRNTMRDILLSKQAFQTNCTFGEFRALRKSHSY